MKNLCNKLQQPNYLFWFSLKLRRLVQYRKPQQGKNKILDSNSVSDCKKSDGVVLPNCDQDEQFRSELISISYAESPDIKMGSIAMGV
ncbi:hypothetical protein P8452_76282 [Trifolium repens]|nr:hypothetical protein P8452_76282 [Trifolium repens]